MIRPYNRALGAKEKHANRASPEEMHPYPRLQRYFHPEGEVCSPLTLVLT